MPEISLKIGGRDYRVTCNAGEEEQLEQAGALLDAEAQTLVKALGRVPEPRMLLMSGLMLADRTTELARRVQAMEAEMAEISQRVREAEDRAATLSAETGDPAALQAAEAKAQAALSLLETATARVEALANGG